MADWKKKGDCWQREYKDYKEYVRHQQSKLANGIPWLKNYDTSYRSLLFGRLCNLEIMLAGKSVLCLGARIGTEVKSFLDAGCFAVGIDLNPGQKNMFVLPGDFHDMIFPDGSVDVVFTNSVDHVLILDKFIRGTKNVLKDGGHFIVEDLGKPKEDQHGGPFECLSFDNPTGFIDKVKAAGFQFISEVTFDVGNGDIGKQYVLQVKKDIVKDYDLCL